MLRVLRDRLGPLLFIRWNEQALGSRLIDSEPE